MTIFGFDMSHYDNPGIGSAVAEGISFITHKAGGDGDDHELGPWWNGVKDLRARILVGAYWVLRPDAGLSAGTQAASFLQRLDSQCPGWRDAPFLLQADCEQWNDKPSTAPSKSYITVFCEQLVVRAPKLRPVVYAPRWVYGDALAGLGYPLWASAYVTPGADRRPQALYPGDTSSRWGAYSGQTPAILQFTDSATIGGQTTCDANAYRGTLAELTALVAPGFANPHILEDDVTPDDIKNIIDGVEARLGGHQFTSPYDGSTKSWAAMWEYAPSRGQVAGVAGQLTTALAMLSTLASRDQVDEAAIVSGILAGLDPQAIASAIPQDIAEQVADILAQRLAA